MRKYLFLLLLLFMPCILYATDGVNTVEHPAKVNSVTTPDKVCGVSGLAAAVGISWDLMDENFDTADGTNLHGYNSWAGTDTNNLEIDTAQYHAGSASAKDFCDSTAQSVSKAITEQTTGIFICEFQVRHNVDTAERYADYFTISDGAYISDSAANNVISLRFKDDNLEFRDGDGTWVDVGQVTKDNWHKIGIEINLTAESVDIYIDEGLSLNDQKAYNADPDTVTIISHRFVGDRTVWIDTLRISTEDTLGY